ncbi:hypothetical protein BSV1_0368 [Borreliella finlandensis]|uniref:Uncharacterized protein n=1 Tax=Borreliella finlandensis TaxID=498741 RepID=A0A826GXV9_9SPIR|nr:hypothetical protein BSV1_0368 [Borreliella finlandensis]
MDSTITKELIPRVNKKYTHIKNLFFIYSFLMQKLKLDFISII